MQVTPGYTFTGTSDPITHTKLNLVAQPVVTLDTSEVNNSNLNSSGGIGYVTGTGGTVTQATSKSTGVTLNKPTGEITLNGAALASDTTVSFVLTNSTIAATDVLTINHASVGTFGAYTFNARCASGSATVDVRNVSTGSLSEAIVLRYVLTKGATS